MHLRTRSRAILLAAPAALVLAAAAACGSAASSPSSGATGATPATSIAPAASADALTVTGDQSLGRIVTTGSGMTVYRYDLDTADPPKSNCIGGCADLWAPVAAPSSGTPKVNGISAGAVGEITRADGTKQLTLAGWPLYTYAGDTAAGQATGQASGGTWWVVSPSGAKITTPAGGSASSAGAATGSGSGAGSGSGGGGYGY